MSNNFMLQFTPQQGGVFKNMLFSSLLGEMFQFAYFQMGWFNHQLDKDGKTPEFLKPKVLKFSQRNFGPKL